METFLNKEELYKILADLIRIDTQNPPGNEDEASRYIYRLFRENGIDAHMEEVLPGRSNVYGFLRGNREGPKIILNGHTDVVPGRASMFVPRYEDGFVWGRGAADMKGSIASMIYATLALNRMGRKFPGELILVFNCDEERTNLGIKEFIKGDITADFAVVGEPTDLDLCTGHKGCLRFTISTEGKAAHTARTTNADNAIDKMADILVRLKKLAPMVNNRQHRFLGNSSLTVSMIRGGRAPNIVPDFCEIEIDRRLIPHEDDRKALDEIKGALDGLDYDLKKYLYLPPSLIENDNEYVLKLKESAERVRKKDVPIKPFQASCEAFFFVGNKSIPAVIFGPGSLEMAHTDHERIDFDQVIEASLILYDFMGGNKKQIP